MGVGAGGRRRSRCGTYGDSRPEEESVEDLRRWHEKSLTGTAAEICSRSRCVLALSLYVQRTARLSSWVVTVPRIFAEILSVSCAARWGEHPLFSGIAPFSSVCFSNGLHDEGWPLSTFVGDDEQAPTKWGRTKGFDWQLPMIFTCVFEVSLSGIIPLKFQFTRVCLVQPYPPSVCWDGRIRDLHSFRHVWINDNPPHRRVKGVIFHSLPSMYDATILTRRRDGDDDFDVRRNTSTSQKQRVSDNAFHSLPSTYESTAACRRVRKTVLLFLHNTHG